MANALFILINIALRPHPPNLWLIVYGFNLFLAFGIYHFLRDASHNKQAFLPYVFRKFCVKVIIVKSKSFFLLSLKCQHFCTYCCPVTLSKSFTRPNNKILIQDKDVFHNIEKAMEVPPVPLPWHVAKKLVEQGKPMVSTLSKVVKICTKKLFKQIICVPLTCKIFKLFEVFVLNF